MSDIAANIVIGMPSQLFTLARSFKAAANGNIYIGVIDEDPTIPSNQIQVYLENEDGTHVPVSQPIKINSGGYPVYNGQIAKFVTVKGHSMKVTDACGVQQFYFPNVLKYDPDQLRSLLAQENSGAVVDDSNVVVKQPFAGAYPTNVHGKMRQIVSLTDFYPDKNGGDGVTDRLAQVNAAIASFGYSGNGEIYVEDGLHVVSAMPTNPYGVEFTGPGMIGIPDDFGGHHRINSYADKNKICIGKEYLYAYYKATRTDPATPGGLLKCVLAGDSTMHGGNGEPPAYKPDILMTRLFQFCGVPNIGVFNRAVPSTSFVDMNILSDLGANTRLLMIKYGVNDAYGPKDVRHKNFMEAMDAKLTEVRNHQWGVFEYLSIILVGPNATNDPEYYRDEEWYETIRGIYVSAARKHKCVYFDTYGLLPDSRKAAGNDMDEPWSDTKPGVAIHPVSERNIWIYGQLFAECFSPTMLKGFALNSWANLPLHVSSVTDSTPPRDLAFDAYETWNQANIVNGFPFSGICITRRQADGLVVQEVYDQATSRVARRSSPIGAVAWGKWTGVPTALALGSSWVNYGTPYNAPTTTLTTDGYALLSGTIKGGTTTANTLICLLPNIPAGQSRHHVATGTGAATATLEIRDTGNGTWGLVIIAGADNALLSLEGLTYRAK